MSKKDNRKFWLGAIMAMLGIVLMFAACFAVEPVGEISGSVLGASGEIFLLAGALLGADAYLDVKLRNMLNGNKDDK